MIALTRKIIAAVVVAIWSVSAGCALHSPQPKDLLIKIPERFTEAGAAVSDVAPDRWWRAFSDDRLNTLMDRAFVDNLDIAQAYARLEQAEAVAVQSAASRFPFVNLGGDAGRARQLGATGPVTGDSYSFSLAAGYEVDLWQKLKSRAEAGALTAEASLEDFRALYLSLSAQVADLYYLLVELRSQLELTDRTIAAREETLALVERRFREGVVSALDVYQSRQTLASARAVRPEIEANLATTAHLLSVLMGGYPDSAAGGDLAELPETPAAFPAGLPSQLLTDRPDIRAQMLRLEARDQEIAAAVADRFPSIDLLGNYGRSGSDFGMSLSGTVWNLSGSLAQPLIDWGARKAEVERSQAVFREQLASYRQTVLTAFREVEDALVRNRTTEEAIRRLKAEEEASGQALRVAWDRYLDGLSEYLPVLTAQALYFDAQSRLLSARRQLISDRISLARATGGNWMADAAEEYRSGA